MSFDVTLPPPVYGISTISDVSREEGYCSIQTNFRNDRREKLTDRPNTTWGHRLFLDDAFTVLEYYNVVKDGRAYVFILTVLSPGTVAGDTTLHMIVDGELTASQQFALVDSVDANSKYGISVVQDTVIVWDKKKVVDITSTSTDFWKNSSLLNVITALNYAETVGLGIYHNDTLLFSVEYTVPGLTGSNQDAADTARATNVVAAELATLINDQISANTGGSSTLLAAAYNYGSNLALEGLLTTGTNTVTMAITSGRGDDQIKVFNFETQDPEGLPKYAPPNTVRSIKPDPRSNSGTYYLLAEEIAGSTGTFPMREVVWVETEDPDDRTQFVEDTLPWEAVFTETTLDVPSKVQWLRRRVGDDDSNDVPFFVGRVIEDVTRVQDRLTIASGRKLIFSKTDEPDEFWRTSATQLLVSDRCEVGISNSDSSIRRTTFHNRDFLVFTENVQAKIPGDIAITPQSVAMPPTTEYACNLDVAPVVMGANVMFAHNYGGSVGVSEYKVTGDSRVDSSEQVTKQIVGLISGEVDIMVGNPNEDILLVRGTGTPRNKLYQYERHVITTQQGAFEVDSWCELEFPATWNIVSVSIYNETVTLIVRDIEGYFQSYTMLFKDDNRQEFSDVAVDNAVTSVVESDGVTVLVNDNYPFADDSVVVAGNAAPYPLQQQYYTYATLLGNHVITLEDPLPAGTNVMVGRKFSSIYEPSTPFIRNRDGSARVTDRLRVSHYMLSLVNTYYLRREVEAKYYPDFPPEEFESRIIPELVTHMNDVPAYTGEHRFSYGMTNTQGVVRFVNDSYLRATVDSITYRAQLFSTKQRR